MSEVEIQVETVIEISMDYDQYTLDKNQAEDLYNMLGTALGKDSRKAA